MTRRRRAIRVSQTAISASTSRIRTSQPAGSSLGVSCLIRSLDICLNHLVAEIDYRTVLKSAEKELIDMFREREALERRIARQRQTVVALRMKVEGDQYPKHHIETFTPKNLTDACRWVLCGATKPLDAPAIRDRVEALAYDIGSSNPLASVHSVLKRLIEQGEVRRAYQLGRGNELLHYTLAFWEVSDVFAPRPVPAGWVLPTDAQIAADLKKRRRVRIPKKYREAIKKEEELRKEYLKPPTLKGEV
jgi:hypothetical protein